MLASSSRLRSSTDIRDVIRKGRRSSADGLTVHLRRLPARVEASEAPAAAFVVPRKVGNAVVRNTITRRLRHLLRERIDAPSSTLSNGDAIVVRVSPEAASLSFDQLGSSLDRCLQGALR